MVAYILSESCWSPLNKFSNCFIYNCCDGCIVLGVCNLLISFFFAKVSNGNSMYKNNFKWYKLICFFTWNVFTRFIDSNRYKFKIVDILWKFNEKLMLLKHFLRIYLQSNYFNLWLDMQYTIQFYKHFCHWPKCACILFRPIQFLYCFSK